MSGFISTFAASFEVMLDYRVALGFSRASHLSSLTSFDRFCADIYPSLGKLTKEVVHKWLEVQAAKEHPNIQEKATAVRLFGKYLAAIGKDAYILPDRFMTKKTSSAPYVFTDAELCKLFSATDTFPAWDKDPFVSVIVPVLFRLIYTCGLRPNEGRELEHSNINLDTGEIFITKTKRKRERIVVMSDDMLRMCKAYEERRRSFAADSRYFFPARDGRAYTTGQLDRMFKQCWAQANPEVSKSVLPQVSVYNLRHRFASAVLNRWLDEKRDLNNMLAYLRAYMGHSKLSDTAYYIHILPENLVKSAGVDWESLNAVLPEVSTWSE